MSYHGDVDVIICEGFVGNVVLKVSEGMAEFVMKKMGATLMEVLSAERDLANEDSGQTDGTVSLSGVRRSAAAWYRWRCASSATDPVTVAQFATLSRWPLKSITITSMLKSLNC
jgi:hypothetical protein